MPQADETAVTTVTARGRRVDVSLPLLLSLAFSGFSSLAGRSGSHAKYYPGTFMWQMVKSYNFIFLGLSVCVCVCVRACVRGCVRACA